LLNKTEYTGEGLRHGLRIIYGRKVNQPHAMIELFYQPLPDLISQSCLPNSAYAE